MNASWKSPRKPRWKELLNRYLWALTVLLVMVALAISHCSTQTGQQAVEPGRPSSQDTSAPAAQSVAELSVETPEPDHIFTRAIAPGDTLSAIFDQLELGQSAMYQILAADEPLLALDILRPGNSLTFTLDEQSRRLEEMELFVHPGKRVVYRRADDSSFDFEEIILPGEWEQQLLNGEINGSFYASALAAGLSERETAQITELFRDQLNFAREIRAGDRFQVVRTQQFVEGEFTGQSRIEGVRIVRRNRLHSAFLFDDGNYYDHKGESLARAFRRYPIERSFRVSSHFNPRRVHPVTGRVAPHNGVDFPMPIGTPVLSTGDGVVSRVGDHPFAGKYIEIEHGGRYATRYLHLDRILVKRGQSVQRGQRIALSGNTGRSTGPHLHFELHVNGRPVNPLTAAIPMSSSVPKEMLASFNSRVKELVAMMEQADQQIAMR